MSSVGAVLTGVSILCIVAGVLLLAAQVRQRPEAPVAPPSGNGSAPPPSPARRPASTRRRILYGLLGAMALTLVVAVVVRERLAWGVHLLVDDAFLAYVAWLARRAETRVPERAVDMPALPRPSPPSSNGEGEEQVTDARA